MRYYLILICLTLLNCKSDKNLTEFNVNEELEAATKLADTYLSKLTDLEKFNGVVLLKKKGQIILRKAYNISDDSTSTLFVSENSQFDLRSVSKLFAKLSIIELEISGKIDRNDPINKYLVDFPNGDIITIQHLMDNTSGLPREFNYHNVDPIQLSPSDILDLAKQEELEFTPGTNERYSNVGFQLLYYIIGKLHNSSFHGFLTDQYFKPLKMMNSGSNFDSIQSKKTNYAFGHYLNEAKSIVCECTPPFDELQMGNLFSTVDDLDIYLSHLDTTRTKLISHKSISHAGGTRGKRAYIERSFNEDYTIIFLANYDAIPFEKLVSDLQKILLYESIEMPKIVSRIPVNVPTSILKRYEGTYDLVDAGHIILTIKCKNDSLYVYQNGKNNGVIYPESETTFFSDKSSEESIIFNKDDKGDYYMLMDFQGVQWKGIQIQ